MTLRTAWNWGVRMNLLTGRFPQDGLQYPKTDEKPPFQARAEILRQLPGLDAASAGDLWECLYLRREEIDALLEFARGGPHIPGFIPWWRPPPTPGHAGANCFGCASGTSISPPAC